MPLGAARISFLAKTSVTAVAEVIRRKVGVEAIGDAQVDTAQSYFGNSSAVFDETGDYLILQDNSFKFGTGDFTIECWVRASKTPANEGIFQLSSTGLRSANTDTLAVAANAGGSSTYWQMYAADGQQSTQAPLQPASATWYHVAMVRTSGNTKLYVNGAEQQTKADTKDYNMTDTLVIGGYYSTSYLWPGNIDEFRISNTARYTSAFTSPTDLFTNDDNTLLLLHMNGTDGSTFFEDDNGVHNRSQKGIFTRGNVQISTTQSKFGGTSAYFTTTAHNDGTSDSIRAENSDDFTFSGDLTWECWFYPIDNNTSSGTYTILANRGSFGTTNLYVAFRQTDNKVQWGNSTMGANITTTTFAFNTWHHVALVREGTATNNFKLYVNGTQEMTDTDTNTIGSGNQNFIAVGCIDSATPAFGFNGYIDEVRISDNARYSGSSITTPTTQFTNDDNTKLLLHMDGTNGDTDFRDDNGKDRSAIGLNAEGNTQIDTAQSNFGGTSAVFDGSGDYLTTNGPNLGSGEWTIEMFARFDSVAGVRVLYDDRESANTATGTVLLYTNGTTLFFNSQQANRISGATLATNTWYHIAVVRDSSNDVKMYLDGTQIGTSWNDTSTYSQQDGDGFFGMNHQSPNNHYFDGYLDEVRFSDTARYTAGFTAPTETFQNDANTLLLLHMDGTDASTVFIDDNGYYPDA